MTTPRENLVCPSCGTVRCELWPTERRPGSGVFENILIPIAPQESPTPVCDICNANLVRRPSV